MGENNDFRNFHDRQNGPDFKDRPTNGGSIRRRLQRNFNIDVQDDPFNDISFTRPASYNLENLNQNNQRQQNEEYPSLPNLTRQEVDDPYSYSTRRVSENDIATQGYSTLPVRRRNRNQHSTNTEHANEELAENILESFMDAQNEGVISMSSIRDRAIRRKKRQVNNRDSKAEMENFWSNIGSNSKDENKTDFLPHVVSRGRKKSITINSEEYFFSDENESSSNELELTGTKPPNRNLDNAQDDEHPHASVVKRRKKTPPENRLSADISFWDNIPSNDRVNESVISNQNTTDQSCDITLTNENQEVLSSTNQNTDVPSNGITLTNQHQELQSRGASLSNENPPVEDTTFSELASQLLGEPEIQVFGDSETILQHKQTDFGQTETTGNLLSPTKETENSGTTKRTFLSSVSHDIQPPSPRRRSSTNTGVANGTTQKGNRNSTVEMEEFWNEVAMRSQSQENLIESSSSDKETTVQSNQLCTDHLKVDDTASNKSPRVQRRSPAVIRRKKRNTEYRNSQAAMDDFWNAIVVHDDQDDSMSDEDGEENEEDDVVRRERPCSFLSVESKGRSSNRNSRGDMEEYWSHVVKESEQQKQEGGEQQQEEDAHGGGERVTSVKSRAQESSDEEIEESPIIKLRRRRKSRIDYRNSRADLEDFWNEITTTENEEKIKDEKSFDIDVDVKEKQHEIESAIEDATSPMFKLFPPLLDTEREETFYRADVDDVEQQAQVSLLDVSGENSIIRRKKKKDANESQRNSRAEVENFWNEIANDGKPTVDNDAPSQPKVIIVDSLDDNSLGLPSRRRPSELRNSQAEIEKFWTEARIRTAAEKLESEETMTVVKRRASEGDVLRDDVRNSRADLEDFWNEITTTENEENIENEKSFDIDVDVKEKQQNVDVEPPQDKSLLDVPVRRRRSDFRNSDADIERFWTEAHIRTAAEKLATEETAVIKRNKTKEDAGESKNDRGKIRNSRLLDEDFWSSFDFENIEEAERKFKDIENDNNKVSPKQSQKQSVGKLKDDIPLESDGDGESSLDESPTNSYMQRWDDDDNSQIDDNDNVSEISSICTDATDSLKRRKSFENRNSRADFDDFWSNIGTTSDEAVSSTYNSSSFESSSTAINDDEEEENDENEKFVENGQELVEQKDAELREHVDDGQIYIPDTPELVENEQKDVELRKFVDDGQIFVADTPELFKNEHKLVENQSESVEKYKIVLSSNDESDDEDEIVVDDFSVGSVVESGVQLVLTEQSSVESEGKYADADHSGVEDNLQQESSKKFVEDEMIEIENAQTKI
eukprot:TCONS_00026268-protein